MIRRLLLVTLFLVAGIATAPNPGLADVTISYGTNEGGTLYIDLQAETPNQIVQLFALGVAADGGSDFMELDVQVGDGGAFLGGTDTAPIMTSIDLTTGTIWATATPTQNDTEVHPLIRQSTVDTSSLVSTDGLIGTIVFDTTGFGTGEINFLLTGVAGSFNTNLLQGTNQLTTIAPNGIIRVTAVPEPASGMVGLIGLVGLALRRRRAS